MSGERVHRAGHSVEVASPAEAVYQLIADAVQWPLLFPATVHVEPLDADGRSQRLRLWERADGRVACRLSHRVLDPHRRRITFRRLDPPAPAGSMTGIWGVQERDGGGSLLTLLHEFTLPGDRPDEAARIARATGEATRTALARLKHLAEHAGTRSALQLAFEDSLRVNGPPELVYDFLYRVGDWPGLVPHVERLDWVEQAPGVQVMSMDTRAAGGTVSTTESVRMCFPHAGRIVHKQTAPAALVAAHTGEWSVLPDERGVTVVAEQRMLLCEQAVRDLPGDGPAASIALARRRVREAVGRRSTATLQLAKRHAESAVRML
ncbi:MULTISPECIES: aromatase/cyclase [Streptomyces]|uniref:Aromatase/cyclase n=1 Tax=Streptomyces achmelvichensis TaxID=3134111 RepID=A0ACC6PNE4_9ACTN|nr:aromatase/cyclase [Streptomyces sp. NBC_01167]